MVVSHAYAPLHSPVSVTPFVLPPSATVKPLDPAKLGTILVFAPHPDDESLGCGGLIASSRQAGNRVEIVVVTDGSKSHPNSAAFPPRKLAAIRRAETRLAALELGVAPRHVHDLGYGDSELPRADERRLEDLTAHFAGLIRRLEPQTVFVPWIHDPHRDHQSVTAAAYAVRRSPRVFRMLEYPIWMDARMGTLAKASSARRIYGADIHAVLGRKRAAIDRHRTQTSAMIVDDPGGFRLTPEMLRGFYNSTEYFFEAA